MRSEIPLPDGVRMYPQILREAGYYCINNSKEDYNLKAPGPVWDESSAEAHWRKRRTGQPFFAVFNHDQMTKMDAMAGANLRELEEDGLGEDTIVFYYGDHGPGMPRGKRWLYNSGLRVPLIVYVPPKWRERVGGEYAPGGRSERMVGFVDLAPTVLSLAGIKPPDYLQGGTFLGPDVQEPEPYMFGLRGRMDERIDLVRAVASSRVELRGALEDESPSVCVAAAEALANYSDPGGSGAGSTWYRLRPPTKVQ